MSTGYGVEIDCTDGLRTGRLVTGWRVVAHALFRRVITPRGTLRGSAEAQAYGIDLAGYVGAVGSATAVAALPGLVRGEWLKDDRVLDVNVTASSATDSAGLVMITLDAAVTLANEGESFDLTLAVSSGGVQLLFAEAA